MSWNDWRLDVALCDGSQRATALPDTMGEIYLDKTLGLLSSDKQKERADSLAGLTLAIFMAAAWVEANKAPDLKHILQKNKKSPKL